MADEQLEFERLISRLRSGDSEAATELVRQYEPEVRRFVRFRLTTPTVRRWIDSLDVSQSVLAKFFVDIESGAVEIRDPDQLRCLLLTMARNKLYDHARKQKAAKRDARRLGTESELEHVADPASTPSEQFATAEIVNAVRAQLAEEDLHLVDQRMEGKSWDDLAQEMQSTAEALRKRMTRAIDRAAQQLGVIRQ